MLKTFSILHKLRYKFLYESKFKKSESSPLHKTETAKAHYVDIPGELEVESPVNN